MKAGHGPAQVYLRAQLESPSDGCMEWPFYRDRDGYGKVRVTRDGHHPVHRIAWELTNGPIPDGLFVCHKCDNPPCFNPAHLFLGTNSENMVDCIAKGRHVDNRGSRHGMSKLTEDVVRAIRADRRAQRVIAAEYGIAQITVSDIKRGARWGWLA